MGKSDKKEKQEKQKVGVELFLEYQEAVSYLQNLLASLKAGKIVVSKDDKFITMIPPSHVGMELEARVKGGKKKFSFELSWDESNEGSVTISDKEPLPQLESQKGCEPDCRKVSGHSGDEAAKKRRLSLLMQQKRLKIKRKRALQAKKKEEGTVAPVAKQAAKAVAKAEATPAAKKANKTISGVKKAGSNPAKAKAGSAKATTAKAKATSKTTTTSTSKKTASKSKAPKSSMKKAASTKK